jgi:predicted kinase
MATHLLQDAAMLIVFSGLPGTGKTTIARGLVTRTQAVYLRIDSIEQAMRNSVVLAEDVGSRGYQVANELALSNLDAGNRVIVDCVNPVRDSREAWSDIARRAKVQLVNIQVICSDALEHQRRVTTRTSDVAGLLPPTWQSVVTHEYEAWDNPPFTLDTALVSAHEAVRVIIEQFFYTATRS